MGIISGGGGGGAPTGAAGGQLGGTYPNPTVDLQSAGGTVAGAVIVAGSDPDAIQLRVKAAVGQAEVISRVDVDGGFPAQRVDQRGDFTAQAYASDLTTTRGSLNVGKGGTSSFAAYDATGVAKAGLSLSAAASRTGLTAGDNETVVAIAEGLLIGGIHAAPADGDLSAGEVALWFDQTNGVGNTKLMVKGKSADGTVKMATILLA